MTASDSGSAHLLCTLSVRNQLRTVQSGTQVKGRFRGVLIQSTDLRRDGWTVATFSSLWSQRSWLKLSLFSLAETCVIFNWPSFLSKLRPSTFPWEILPWWHCASRAELRKTLAAVSEPLLSTFGRFGLLFWDITFQVCLYFGRFWTIRKTCVSNVMEIEKEKCLTHSSFPKE